MTATYEGGGLHGLPNCVEFVSRGFRDVFWCPYVNEPVVLMYRKDYALDNKRPYCDLCSKWMDEDHTFICTVKKP